MYVGTKSENFRTSYHAEFPMAEVMNPPRGWIVRFVNKHRALCPDTCWRLVLKREIKII